MPVHLAYSLYHSLWSGLDWLFPPRCGGCGRQGSRWCLGCQSQTSLVLSPLCPICGAPQPTEALCQRCRSTPPVLTALRSWAVFGGTVRQAIHKLKYGRDISLGDALAVYLIDLVRQTGWHIDLVTPVPLGLARIKQRGYNQASLLARPLAYALGASYHPKAIRRTRETRTQVGLNVVERQQNVAGAFFAFEELVRGKNILIVDDVTTTGSTLNACALALKEAGGALIYGLTLARSVQATLSDSHASNRLIDLDRV